MKKLKLKKEVVANLDQFKSSNIKGGGFTSGCTDGCTGSMVACSAWRCTHADCTNDCDTVAVCLSWACNERRQDDDIH